MNSYSILGFWALLLARALAGLWSSAGLHRAGPVQVCFQSRVQDHLSYKPLEPRGLGWGGTGSSKKDYYRLHMIRSVDYGSCVPGDSYIVPFWVVYDNPL